MSCGIRDFWSSGAARSFRFGSAASHTERSSNFRGGVRLLTAGSLRRRMYSGWYFSPIPADRYPLPMPPSRYIVSALILGTPPALPIDGHLTSHAFGIPFMLAIVFQVWGWFGGLPRAGH